MRVDKRPVAVACAALVAAAAFATPVGAVVVREKVAVSDGNRFCTGSVNRIVRRGDVIVVRGQWDCDSAATTSDRVVATVLGPKGNVRSENELELEAPSSRYRVRVGCPVKIPTVEVTFRLADTDASETLRYSDLSL
jgi:hypothetical protein